MQETTVEQFLKAYDDHADAIYRHCFFRVFSKPQAEELVQEAFMRTWDYLQDGKKVDNIRAFLYRVANNLIIDQARKKREDSLENILEDSPGLEPVAEDNPLLGAENNSLMSEIKQVMDLLPEMDGRIISMRYVDELDISEIAEILDISNNHVSVRISRAMKNLREILESRGFNNKE